MVVTRLGLAAAAAASLAAASSPAWGVGIFTVQEGSAPDVTVAGTTTWFNGMYSPQGNPRGHVMGYGPVGGPWTQAMAFGSGARIVARGPGMRRVILGGTGRYLGATGVVMSRTVNGAFVHRVRYGLPPAGTPRVSKAVLVRLSPAVVTPRGGPAGVGDGRGIDGTVLDAAGTRVGTYRVDSTLVKVFSGGTREWFLGEFTYALADGSLRAVGPYLRATASAPGVLAASGRVVVSGTGAYAGMRGQVVVLPPNPDGTSTHSFTLIRG
ncbi:MAG: hypothetical protein ISP32_08170 [Thermoleophilia bacterium]|nr:hypothetical protein [Thermoleophilia bacterium]